MEKYEGILSVRKSGNHTRKWKRCYEVVFAHVAEIDPCVHYQEVQPNAK